MGRQLLYCYCHLGGLEEDWSGLPRPPPRDLPDPGIETGSPALQADSLLLSHREGPGGGHGPRDCWLQMGGGYWVRGGAEMPRRMVWRGL